MKKRIKCINQLNSNDCGIACILMICNYYNQSKNYADLKKQIHVSINGITPKQIIDYFNENEFNCIKKIINNRIQLPCIAIIKENSYYHYVLLYKFTNKNVYICDPVRGKYKLPIKHLKNKILKYGIEVFPRVKLYAKIKKNSLTKQIFKSLLVKEWKLTLLIIIISTFVTILSLTSLLYNNLLIDKLIPSKNITYLLMIFLIFGILIILRSILSFFRKFFIFKYSQDIDKMILMGLYEKTIYLPYDFFAERQTGDILARFDDAISVRETLSTATVTLFMDCILAIGAGFILFNIHTVLFYMAFIPIIIYIASIFIFKKIIARLNLETMQCNAALDSSLIEMISQIELIKTFCIENDYLSKIHSHFQKLLKKSFAIANVSSLQIVINEMVHGLFILCIMCMGSYFIIQNEMTLGNLITYNSIVIYFMDPVEKILQMQNTFQKSIIAVKRLEEVIVSPYDFDINYGIGQIESNKDIIFEAVSFGYDRYKPILKDLNLTIPKNKKVALIGKSGSGKTTMAKLLMRLYDIDSGSIKIGNVDICSIHKQLVRKIIGYVGQESFFFSGTILENINLKNRPLNEVIEVCKMVRIHDFILSLPNKYSSQIHENGKNFSAGQRQRLSLARAILTNPNILILDEATSNLDVNTELEIDKLLSKLKDSMTIIVIAHRLSTISRCDYIYFLANGKIIESGTHDELLKKKKEYYNMWIKREVIK